MAISLPKSITPYPDRDLDCQMALEDIFVSVLDLAEQSGWSRTEAAIAIQELALNRLAADEANLQTELAILKATQVKH